MTGSSIDTQCVKDERVEVDISYKVAIPKSRVELEHEKNKEYWKWELNRTPTSRPDVRNRIAKAHKLIK